MKKSLSLLVAIAMVFSMFAAVASAAEETKLTTEQKYEELVKAGLFEGYPDGEAHLDKEMTRAQASKIVALLTGYSEGVEVKDAGYTDLVGAGWATDYINYATQVGILEGKGNNKFDPSAQVTVQQLATIAVKLAKHADVTVPAGEEVQGKVDAWAADAVASAIAAGLLAKQDDYTVNANRGVLVEVVFSAKEILAQAGALAIAKVAQTDNREITVSFNKEVSAEAKAEIKEITVKKGTISYTVTNKWAEDNKSLVLSSNFLPAGEYTVTLTGFDAKTVVVTDEKATSIEIGAANLQADVNGQDLGVKVLNQFGKEMKNAKPVITAFNANRVGNLTVANGKVDLGLKGNIEQSKIGDTIVVTASLNAVIATKNYTVVAGSAATVIKFGEVQPLKDKTHITAGEKGLKLPVELVDQYGNNIKFTKNATATVNGSTFTLDNIFFTVNSTNVIEKLYTDKDGILLFDVYANAPATTVVLTAINPATSANASTNFKVETKSVVKSVDILAPASVIVKDESTVFALNVIDQFGQVIPGKDVAGKNITFNISPANSYYVNAKGELVVKFTATGPAFITAVAEQQQVGSLFNLTVDKAKELKSISGTKDLIQNLVIGTSTDLDEDNILAIDDYNRIANVPAGSYKVTSGNPGVATYNAGKITAVTEGTSEFTIELLDGSNVVADSEYKFTVTVVKAADVKEFEVKSIGTIYGKGNGSHDVDVTVNGKLNGGKVVIPEKTVTHVTSSLTSIATIEGDVDNGFKVRGVKAGTTTIKAFDVNGKMLGEQVVTVSEEAPVPTTVKFAKETVDVNGAVGTTESIKLDLKDQYGIKVTANTGFVFSSDKTIAEASISGDNVVVTSVARGVVTIQYVASNGTIAVLNVAVNIITP